MATLIRILTIGHSTRAIEAFTRLLEAHGVQRVIDVRTIPRSGHNPHFNRSQLSPALHRARIHYRHMPGLGGLRPPRRDSINTGWRNAGFRGYADYMQTPAFEESLARCIELAEREQAVLMCAEGMPVQTASDSITQRQAGGDLVDDLGGRVALFSAGLPRGGRP